MSSPLPEPEQVHDKLFIDLVCCPVPIALLFYNDDVLSAKDDHTAEPDMHENNGSHGVSEPLMRQ